MSDTSTAADAGGSRFPFINLEKAIARAKQIYDADHQGREMPIATAFEVWGYSLKSSGGHQTVGALKMYDLIRDSGALDTRKLALSTNALRYFRDEREDERKKLLVGFALAPKFFQALWNSWRASPPSDPVARSHLKLERGLGEQNARAVLSTYKENLDFAGLKGDAKIPEVTPEAGTQTGNPPVNPKAKVGDYIQWISDGAEQFRTPRQVEWISDDSRYLRVFGSPTGIPMNEISVAQAPGAKVPASAQTPPVSTGTKPDITVYQVGGRLQITADVDEDGIEKLESILAKYKEILKLMN